jgi:hypothetical protein
MAILLPTPEQALATMATDLHATDDSAEQQRSTV